MFSYKGPDINLNDLSCDQLILDVKSKHMGRGLIVIVRRVTTLILYRFYKYKKYLFIFKNLFEYCRIFIFF